MNQKETIIFLKEGEMAMAGDQYDMGKGRMATVGTNETYVKPGMPWPAEMMTYKPRRKIKADKSIQPA